MTVSERQCQWQWFTTGGRRSSGAAEPVGVCTCVVYSVYGLARENVGASVVCGVGNFYSAPSPWGAAISEDLGVTNKHSSATDVWWLSGTTGVCINGVAGVVRQCTCTCAAVLVSRLGGEQGGGWSLQHNELVRPAESAEVSSECPHVLLFLLLTFTVGWSVCPPSTAAGSHSGR